MGAFSGISFPLTRIGDNSFSMIMFANRQKKGCTRRWCTPFFESYVAIFQYSRFFGICQLFQFCIWGWGDVWWHLRKPSCGWFGRYASLSACVLFASGYVFRIGYESFLDFGLSEFSMLLEWRTAFSYIPQIGRASCRERV